MAVYNGCTGQELIEGIQSLIEETGSLSENVSMLKSRVTPIKDGGTGANNAKDARENLEIHNLNSYFEFIAAQTADTLDAAFGKNNEDIVFDIGKQMAMYAWFKGTDKTVYPFTNLVKMLRLGDMSSSAFVEIVTSDFLLSLIKSSPYALDTYFDTYSHRWGSNDNTSNIVSGSVDITVTEEDLTRPFYWYYYLRQRYNLAGVTIKINGSVVASLTSELTDSSGYYCIHKSIKNWSDFGITSAGNYKIEYSSGDGNNLWREYSTFELIKMKG